MSRPSHQSGFTLVETLVALAIVALSFAVLLRIVSDNLDRTRRARDEATASSLVQSVLAQAETGTPSTGTTSGRFADGFGWRLQVMPYEGALPDWQVGAVTIAATVSWRDGAATQSRTLTTLRVIPKASPQ
jgi:general secretion pathway protein I